MKFLVVGLGSMGKRRIRNLQELKVEEIIGFDTREDRRKDASNMYSIEIAETLDLALRKKPDAMIISTPPHKHLEYMIIAVRNNIHFFTEVNTMSPNDLQIVINLLKKKKIVGLPSTNLMFHPSVIKMKNLLKNGSIGKPLLFNFHSGSYLPDWHPWEKLQDYYVYAKETGGGRDQIAWELSWIMSLMGKPKNVMANTKKLGSFRANIFDVYDLLIEFENNAIGHIMVDVVQRPPGRICEIVGDKGMMKWEYDERLVKINSSDKKKWIEYPEKLDYRGYKIEKPKRGFAIKDT
ncbi:MAG TPA: Gfo/Idh/MocA family oxidoreductase, partial [Aquella sp.]|nr:Gfo/Idh/MocA family oxidoreductase [Aquella sp.]